MKFIRKQQPASTSSEKKALDKELQLGDLYGGNNDGDALWVMV